MGAIYVVVGHARWVLWEDLQKDIINTRNNIAV